MAWRLPLGPTSARSFATVVVCKKDILAAGCTPEGLVHAVGDQQVWVLWAEGHCLHRGCVALQLGQFFAGPQAPHPAVHGTGRDLLGGDHRDGN